MKKHYIFIAIALLLIAPTLTFAQVKPVTAPTTEVIPTVPENLKNETLAVKKAYVEDQLRNLLAQLNTIYTRTKITTDLLGERNIKTQTAQAELDKASVALTDARLTIDSFSVVQLPPETDRSKVIATSASMKELVKGAEDNLKVARTSLIASLGFLKTSIIASMKVSQ